MQWPPAYITELAHLLQHTVDVWHDILPVHKHRCVGPVPQCSVQHSAILPWRDIAHNTGWHKTYVCAHACVLPGIRRLTSVKLIFSPENMRSRACSTPRSLA